MMNKFFAFALTFAMAGMALAAEFQVVIDGTADGIGLNAGKVTGLTTKKAGNKLVFSGTAGDKWEEKTIVFTADKAGKAELSLTSADDGKVAYDIVAKNGKSAGNGSFHMALAAKIAAKNPTAIPMWAKTGEPTLVKDGAAADDDKAFIVVDAKNFITQGTKIDEKFVGKEYTITFQVKAADGAAPKKTTEKKATEKKATNAAEKKTPEKKAPAKKEDKKAAK